MDDTQRAIGATESRTPAQQVGNVTYGVMPEQIIRALKDMNPGSEFLLIQQVRQSEEPRIWSSGDPEQTKSVFRSAYTALAFDPDTVLA